MEVELPPGEPDSRSWAFGSNRDRVRQFSYLKPVCVCALLTRRCTQVCQIAKKNLFLNEAYRPPRRSSRPSRGAPVVSSAPAAANTQWHVTPRSPASLAAWLPG